MNQSNPNKPSADFNAQNRQANPAGQTKMAQKDGQEPETACGSNKESACSGDKGDMVKKGAA